ncbi:unnamed protein product [Mytilus edulis]|uniref:VWFD domain-containing protein n=1 Tax=Mytilus edulis TaxID=6550 RepID=A0A8S3TYY9_MYTED|nr:unnamed protein product [Mytilus edulis]
MDFFKHRCCIFLTLTAYVSYVELTSGSGSYLDPFQQYVIQGHDAILQCIYETLKESIKWYDMHAKVIAERSTVIDRTKYKVSFSRYGTALWVSSLHVLNAQPGDQMIYGCGSEITSRYFIQLIVYDDPCTIYDKIENQEQRSTNHSYDWDAIAINDVVLHEGWYRIISRSGTDMPTSAQDMYSCGTKNPIWLNGALPSVEDGIVTRTVCTQTSSGSCDSSWDINIKNCTDYNVYYLKSSQVSDSAYCFGTGGVQCPIGWSSYNGFYPGCNNTGFPTEEVIPHVDSILVEEPRLNQKVPSLVMVFQCIFGEVSNYVYDVYWYINAHYLTEHNNILYSNIRQTDLRPDDWVGKHHMNMIVRCSVRLRNEAESFPGPYYESDWFKAGIYPEELNYQVIEGESTMITYEATVSVGCYQADQTAHCNQILYVTQPQYQESPATCSSSKISQQDIAFNSFQFCGITVPSVYRDSDSKIQFNVTGYIDGQYNKGIQRTTRLRLLSLENKVDSSGAWDIITIPDIKISVTDADEKMKNRLCKVYNDPHFVTADGKRYDYYGVGEYILYKNTKYPYQVNALFTKCGGASCNCGVAIQAGQSLFVVRTTEGISKTKSVRGLSTPIVDKRICDDKSMVIEENTVSKTFDVTLPIGTTVSFKYTEKLITYIHVKPSVLDLESAEGLCGYISSQNGKKDDDFRKRNETVATTSKSDFAKSWDVTGTNESLFQENPPILSYQNNLHSYCTCANEAGTQGGLKDHNVLHCNLSQPMEACYDVKTDLSLDSRCSNGNLQPKLASDQLRRGIRSTDDTDDVIDFTPLIISDDVFDESISIEVPEWTNGWSYELAESTCTEYLNKRFSPDLSEITGEYPSDYIGTMKDIITQAKQHELIEVSRMSKDRLLDKLQEQIREDRKSLGIKLRYIH